MASKRQVDSYLRGEIKRKFLVVVPWAWVVTETQMLAAIMNAPVERVREFLVEVVLELRPASRKSEDWPADPFTVVETPPTPKLLGVEGSATCVQLVIKVAIAGAPHRFRVEIDDPYLEVSHQAWGGDWVRFLREAAPDDQSVSHIESLLRAAVQLWINSEPYRTANSI